MAARKMTIKNKGSQGRGPVTIRDICAHTGFSVATVSRAMNNKPKVSKEARATIFKAIRDLGFTPNAIARMLSRKQTDIIGVIFHQMTSGFYATVMSGIDLEARSRRLHVLSTIVHHADPERDGYYDMVGEARVDGLIVLDSTMDAPTLERLKSYRRPLVLIEPSINDPRISTISSANEQGAYLAVRHLLKLGYRDLLLVLGAPEACDTRLRLSGCRKALAEQGLSMRRVDTITGYYSAHEAVVAFRKYLRERKKRPRAIFSFNDDMALSIMKELRLTGVRVPDEVAVVGYDGIEAADYMGLTTIRTPMLEMGHEAVKLLAARIENPAAKATHVVLKGELIVRESCGAQQSG